MNIKPIKVCKVANNAFGENLYASLMFGVHAYPQQFIYSVTNKSAQNRRLSYRRTLMGTAIIPSVRGVSEKFRQTGNTFNIRTVFKTISRPTLHESLMISRPDSDIQDIRQCTYRILF
jgi:hypothetical protein